MRASLFVGVVCWVVMNFIFLPYDMYWLFQFWQKKDSLIISKRYPQLLACSLVLNWIWMICFYTLILFVIEDDLHYLMVIVQTVIRPFLLAEIAIGTTRYWLIFYAITYNYGIKTNKWRNVINPTKQKLNWFLKNKDKFGNYHYLRIRVFLFTLALYCIMLIPDILHLCDIDAGIFRLFAILVFLLFVIVLPMLLNVFMLCQVPNLEDNIGLRSELRFTVFCISLIFILSVAFGVTIYQVATSTSISMDEHYGIFLYIWFTLIRTTLLIRTLRHTRWPLITFKAIIMDRFSESKEIELAHKRTLMFQEASALRFGGDDVAQKLTRSEMNDILNDNRMFDAFMQLLLSEYCAECLLSVIEFIQFKERLVADNKYIEFKDNITLELPELCPKSSIVHKEDDYKRIVLRFYEKYIRIGAEWEINIDYSKRNRYKMLLCDENVWINNDEYDGVDGLLRFYVLFDPCIDAVLSLLCSSFTRFKNSKQYKVLLSYKAPILLNPIQIIRSYSH